MNVLVYSPLALYNPHFETELDLALGHLENGDRVTFTKCNGSLAGTCGAAYYQPEACKLCASRFDSGMNFLRTKFDAISVIDLSKEMPKINVELADFKTTEALKKIEYKGADIGEAVHSSIVDITRDSEPDLKNYQSLISSSLTDCIRVYSYLESVLDKGDFGVGYLFNGRISIIRPIVRLFQRKKIKFYVHERAGSLEKFSFILNTYPHDLNYKKVEVDEAWQSCTNNEVMNKVGNEWFVNKIQGRALSWLSYTSQQMKALLPDNFNKVTVRKVSIFISSEDELSAMGEWKNLIYENQNDGLLKIFTDLSSHPIHFFLRVHPNLRDKENTQTKFYKNLSFSNVTVISANDSVDTYELVKQSSAVLTFGSTVGIEANYLGVPSILAGRTIYEDLGGTYNPKNHQDVIRLLLDENLKPLDPIASIKYGYYENTYGRSFKHYKPEGLFHGNFDGVEIKPSIFAKFISKLIKLKIKFLK